MSNCNFSSSHFGFEGRTLVLIAPVPGLWLPETFKHCKAVQINEANELRTKPAI